MLDKRSSILLEKINELCEDGGYKIFDEEDLLSCFPEKYKTDADALAQTVRYLREHKYIDVKYAEGGMYCLCPLPEGRMYFENVKDARGKSFRLRRDTVLLTVLGAFLGAFTGSILVWLMITYLF